jgi:hypothetical protein
MALCAASASTQPFYVDVLAQVDVSDLSTHNSLAVFTSILIGKHKPHVLIILFM